jgi:hypothetical protein
MSMVSKPGTVGGFEEGSGPMIAGTSIKRCLALCTSVYYTRDTHVIQAAETDTHDGNRRRFYCDGLMTDTQVVCQQSKLHGIEIIVRGTGTPWGLITDMKCWQSKIPRINGEDYGSAHHGFLMGALDVLKPIRSWLEGAHSTYIHDRPVILCGHSLGAGVATILAPMLHDLTKHTIVVTFGSPRVGDLTFANAIRSTEFMRIIRVANEDDPVAFVPILGYHHTGNALVMPRRPCVVKHATGGKLQWHTPLVEWTRYHLTQITQYVPSVEAHSLAEYKARMDETV